MPCFCNVVAGPIPETINNWGDLNYGVIGHRSTHDPLLQERRTFV